MIFSLGGLAACSDDDAASCSDLNKVQLTGGGCYLEATCQGEMMTLGCFSVSSPTPGGTKQFHSFSCNSKESPWQVSRTYAVGASAQSCCTVGGFVEGCGLTLPSGFADKAGDVDSGIFDAGDAAAADGP